MLIKKISIIVCATAGMLASSFASAQVYFGGSVGQSDKGNYCSNSTTCDSKATSYKVFGGYNIDKNFAVESSYFSAGKTSINSGLALGRSEQKKTGFSLAGVYNYEFNEAFSGFGKLGFARLKTDSFYDTSGLPPTNYSYTENHALYGLGLAYKINANLSVRAELEVYNPKTFSNRGTSVSNLSAGLQYNF
ncbi:outer membrane beta-barrel protein [Undibacterium sp. CY18W]|uniref:Outer membrane beta-barrel protein n=1 Tax=Undibacterium hunanense TaxID=2762292 RepID=A0ABR6ZTW1_9BURK|nr:outer membrane beta-barrel protein [Undibacterium hunanense]MBC3919331.1 outer membrane beta-barrel protein [Undibacterium hunanense]